MNATDLSILSVRTAPGAHHDFRLFKESKLIIHPDTILKADSGYQGIHHLHANSRTPQKHTKLHPLTKAQKKANHQFSSDRILVEHVIGRIKRFKIVSDRYRNRRRRFNLRMNLLAGVYNYELWGGF